MYNSSIEDIAKLLLPSIAVIISVASLIYAQKTWRDSNRPLITVRITSNDMGGNMATPLYLLIENTGNRPAKNIRLNIDPDKLNEVILDTGADVLLKEIRLIFSDETTIPVLANGKKVINSFGLISGGNESTWKPWSTLQVKVTYEDLDGHKFHGAMNILLADDEGFAGGIWSKQ